MSRQLRSAVPHAAQLSSLSTLRPFNASYCPLRLTPVLSNSSALFHSFRQNPIFAALCFQAVAHSLKMCISATPFASATSALFAKNTGVGGTPLFPPPLRSDFQTSRQHNLPRHLLALLALRYEGSHEGPSASTHRLTSTRARVTIAVTKRGNRLPAASVLRLSSPLGRRWG